MSRTWHLQCWCQSPVRLNFFSLDLNTFLGHNANAVLERWTVMINNRSRCRRHSREQSHGNHDSTVVWSLDPSIVRLVLCSSYWNSRELFESNLEPNDWRCLSWSETPCKPSLYHWYDQGTYLQNKTTIAVIKWRIDRRTVRRFRFLRRQYWSTMGSVLFVDDTSDVYTKRTELTVSFRFHPLAPNLHLYEQWYNHHDRIEVKLVVLTLWRRSLLWCSPHRINHRQVPKWCDRWLDGYVADCGTWPMNRTNQEHQQPRSHHHWKRRLRRTNRWRWDFYPMKGRDSEWLFYAVKSKLTPCVCECFVQHRFPTDRWCSSCWYCQCWNHLCHWSYRDGRQRDWMCWSLFVLFSSE